MSEKTEKATPKQLRDAREKGQIAQSQDVSKLLILLLVSETVLGLAIQSVERLKQLIELSVNATQQPFERIVGQLLTEAVAVLIPFLALSVGLAMLMRRRQSVTTERSTVDPQAGTRVQQRSTETDPML